MWSAAGRHYGVFFHHAVTHFWHQQTAVEIDLGTAWPVPTTRNEILEVTLTCPQPL